MNLKLLIQKYLDIYTFHIYRSTCGDRSRIIRGDPCAPGSVRLSPPSKDVPPLRPDHVSPGHVSRASPVTQLQARVTTVTRADTKLGLRGGLTDLARGSEVVQVPGTEVSVKILSELGELDNY